MPALAATALSVSVPVLRSPRVRALLFAAAATGMITACDVESEGDLDFEAVETRSAQNLTPVLCSVAGSNEPGNVIYVDAGQAQGPQLQLVYQIACWHASIPDGGQPQFHPAVLQQYHVTPIDPGEFDFHDFNFVCPQEIYFKLNSTSPCIMGDGSVGTITTYNSCRTRQQLNGLGQCEVVDTVCVTTGHSDCV